MYTTEAQFRERGITVTFKKQSPYPLTETQASAPLPTVLEVDGRRRYLSDIQLLERELQSFTASHRHRKKIPGTPNGRPHVHPFVPLGRAASCGIPSKTSFLNGARGELKETSAVLERKQSSIFVLDTLPEPSSDIMPMLAEHSSTTEVHQGRARSRVGYNSQLASMEAFPATTVGSRTHSSLLECLPLHISNWGEDNSISICNNGAPSSSLWVHELDINDKPEVELGAVVGLALDNTDGVDEEPVAFKVDLVADEPRPITSLKPVGSHTDVDLCIGDLSTSYNMCTSGSFMTVSRSKVALGRDTPSPRHTTEFTSNPLVVQSYTFPEKLRSFSNSKSVTIRPERSSRILKDVMSIDCGTMTVNVENINTSRDDTLISAIGSELITAITEQKLASDTQHPNSKSPSTHLNKQEGGFRIVQKRQKKYLLNENYITNASQQLNLHTTITSQAIENYDTFDVNKKQNADLGIDIVHSDPLSSRASTDRSVKLQTKIIEEASENHLEPSTEHPINRQSIDDIGKDRVLTVSEEALSKNITIYHTEDSGVILEDDDYNKQHLSQKIDSEDIVCYDDDDTFLNSLNKMRRNYGLENAYNNFGAFLSNVSDFIRECSISSATELPSSLSNDPLRRNSLSSTLQLSDNPLPRKRSQLRTERLAQLHKVGNKKRNAPNTLLSKEQMTEKIDILLSLPLQSPAPENTVCEYKITENEETCNYSAPLVAIEQAETSLLPQLRVVALPSNSTKDISVSNEVYATLPKACDEKPVVPPLEFQTHLPAISMSTGASSSSCTNTSKRHKSCAQPPNTPHIPHTPRMPYTPECLPISVLSAKNLNKNVYKSSISSDAPNNSICSSQSIEPGPFKPRLHGFEEGGTNDAAISSAFATLKLVGYLSKSRSIPVNRSSYERSKSNPVSSTLQSSSDTNLLTGELPVLAVATKRRTVNEAAVGNDPNKLIVARSALEDLLNMSDSEFSALREASVPVGEVREDMLLSQCMDRGASESGQ